MSAAAVREATMKLFGREVRSLGEAKNVKAAGEDVPQAPPRKGSRMKKAAPPPPRTAVSPVVRSEPSSPLSSPVSSSGPAPPLPPSGDECAINELLEGRMDLQVVLPDNRKVHMNVERRTPMMDLLIQATTANKLNPSGHVIQVLTDQGRDFVHYKPNTAIGSLDAKQVYIVPKSAITTDMPLRKGPKCTKQPFESTFRLQVRLPRNQLMVMRVSLRMTLAEVKQTVCDEKSLDNSNYQLVHPSRPGSALDLGLTLEEYGATEIALLSNRAVAASLHSSSTADLISYSAKEDDKKKGIIGLLTRQRSKGSLTGSSSDGVSSSSRGVSPTRSDPIPTRPAKKRPAPPPPPQAGDRQRLPSSNRTSECAPSHSRHSSDSSGYHEASVFSDLPETPSPEAFSGSSGVGSLDTPPQSLVVTRPSTSSSKARPDSMVSEGSVVTHGKKRRAPPPPPGKPREMPSNVPVEPSPTINGEVTEPSAGIRPNHLEGLQDQQASSDDGNDGGGELFTILAPPPAFASPHETTTSLITNPVPKPRLTLKHKQVTEPNLHQIVRRNSEEAAEAVILEERKCKGWSSTADLSEPVRERPSIHIEYHDELTEPYLEDMVVTQEQLLSHIDATFGAIEEQEGSTTEHLSWEYTLPEPPSPFRSDRPDFPEEDGVSTSVTAPGTVVATEPALGEATLEADDENLNDDSSLVDSGHAENFGDLEDQLADEITESLDKLTCDSVDALNESQDDPERTILPSDDVHDKTIQALDVSCHEEISRMDSLSSGTSSLSPPLSEDAPESPQSKTAESSEHLDSLSSSPEPPVVLPSSTEVIRHERTDSQCSVSSTNSTERISPSVNYGPISFSIGSYGSYKTEKVEDIFGTDSKNRFERFKHIKVASPNQLVSSSSLEKEISSFKNDDNKMPPPSTNTSTRHIPRVSIGSFHEREGKQRPDFKTVISEQPYSKVAESFLEKPWEINGKSSSMLDLRPLEKPEAANSSKDTDFRSLEVNGDDDDDDDSNTLEVEKDSLRSEYAKLQKQFLAWQQQLADNQSLLEDKKIVPSMNVPTLTSLPSNDKSEFVEKEPVEVKADTLPRTKPRPSNIVEERRRVFLQKTISQPKIQVGSWQERKEENTVKPAAVLPENPKEEVINGSRNTEKFSQPTEPILSKPAFQIKIGSSVPKVEPKPLANSRKSAFCLNPIVKGFSAKDMERITEEMNSQKQPEPKISRSVSCEPVKSYSNKPLVNGHRPKVMDHGPKVINITPEDQLINKPSIVQATLKSGITTPIPPPPPPPPMENSSVVAKPAQKLNGHHEVDSRSKSSNKIANGQAGKSVSAMPNEASRPKKVVPSKSLPPPSLDPREELMIEIRRFGGKNALRKVSSQSSWQLKVYGLQSTTTA